MTGASETSGGRAHTSAIDWYLLFPLLAALALVAAGNDAFGFDPPGWLDAFMYLGYFWHYPEHLPLFDDYYKISRLAWILPGFAAHSLGGAIIGSLVLAGTTLAAGAVAMYLLVRDALEDRAVAAVTGVAWACCTWAHGIGGWNYHVLAAADFYLCACWLFVRAGRYAHGRAAAVSAGAMAAAAVHTHIFLVVFLPLLAVLYWASLPRSEPRVVARGLHAALLATVGALALTAGLSVINYSTGGAWLFFMPQVDQVFRLSQPGNDKWWLGDLMQWLPAARYLVMPLALMIAGVGALFRNQGAVHGRRLPVTLVALAWGAFALMCVTQFVGHQTTLDYNYMAFAAYLHAFPCAAAAVAQPAGRRSLSFGAPLVASAVVLLPLILLMPALVPGAIAAVTAPIGLGSLPPIVLPLLVSLAGVVVMWLVPVRARLTTFAVWFSLVNIWVAPIPTSYGIGTPGIHRQMLSLFYEADRFTTELDPSLVGIKYWLASEQMTTPAGPIAIASVFDSFVATRTWLPNLLARKSPGIPIDQLTTAHLDRGACVGILSTTLNQARFAQEMQSHFAALGRPLRAVAARQFEGPGLSFALTVLKPVAADGTAPQADAAPPCIRDAQGE